MAQHSSRLHRLLTLLDTGSTQATRFAAARQIGDIAKSHPRDLNSLLKKVSQYLRSRNWDTRVAAAHAVGAIAENVKHTSLRELSEHVEMEMTEAGLSDACKEGTATLFDICPTAAVGLTFKSFDINKVLEFGFPLFASGGQEYDVSSDCSKTPAERLARQKQNLRRRLGLDVCEQFMDVSDVIKDEDLMAQKGFSYSNGPNNGSGAIRAGQNIHQLVLNMAPSIRPRKLSAREFNLLKRRAKVYTKDQSKCNSEDDELSGPISQNSVNPRGILSDPSGSSKDMQDSIVDEDIEHDASGRWPFQNFVELLSHDIFDPVWEVRHGAMMALREILTHQGSSAGVCFPDLSLEDSSVLSDERSYRGTKRERDIDLNMQLDSDECEPESKKIEISQETDLLQNTMVYSEKLNIDNCLSMEFGTSSPSNGNLDKVNVKVEPDLFNGDYSNQIQEGDSARQKSLAGDITSFSKDNFLTNLPENSKLMKLVKIARHSWNKNSDILQDCAIRFLCVLSLDRFGDYVSDQVVAPVRETCAQALGAVMKYMHHSVVYDTLRILLQMQCRKEWETRHGSLLGIKYLVAVRPEMLQGLLIYVLPACKSGLEDPDDDVRAVAAEALIPTAAAIVSLDDQMLHSIVMLLWDILLDLDDLSPSTSSVMNLLAEIYSQPEMVPKMLDMLKDSGKKEIDLNEISQVGELGDNSRYKENPYMLSTLTPRLWPFMRHSITSVRLSAIRTLERLLEIGYSRSFEALDTMFWPTSILGDALRIVFQNLLLESNDDILHSSQRVWRLLLQCPEQYLDSVVKSYFISWMQLVTTPYGSPLDASIMYWPVALPRKSHFRAAAKMRAQMQDTDNDKHISFGCSLKENSLQEKGFDASMNTSKLIVGADSEKSVTYTRVVTAESLGILASKLPETSLSVVVDSLQNGLMSNSGVQRQVASMVLVAWFRELKCKDPSSTIRNFHNLDNLNYWLLDLLSCTDPAFPTKDSLLPYAELSRTYSKMRSEATFLFQAVDSVELSKSSSSSMQLNSDSLTVDGAITFASKVLMLIESNLSGNLENHISDAIESSRQRVLSTSGYLKCVQNNLHVTVSASVAAAVVWMSELPSKLNPVILPLMAAIKREQEEILQQKAAEALSELIFHCIGRKPSPNDKLIKNLCNLACTDSSETPQAAIVTSMEVIEEQNLLSLGKVASVQKYKHQTTSGSEDKSKVEGFISRRGSELALKLLCEKFGFLLFDKLPKLWECLTEVLKPVSQESVVLIDYSQMLQTADGTKDTDPQTLINNIQVIRSLAPFLDESLRPRLLSLLPCILYCACHHNVAVRLAASRCITSMAKSMSTIVMGPVVGALLPMLSDSGSVHARQGAGMLVSLLVQGLGVELVPYAPLLVVPLLRCMGDSDPTVRQTVTLSFAALVPLLPLARGVPLPDGLSGIFSKNTEDAQFLEQLLDNSHIDDYKLPIDLKVTLRRYQQEGINWLAFLRRFKLHGILCDDMGLGKTLQASAMIASDTVERRACNSDKDSQSLIVCPSTLVGHWAYEIDKYIDNSIMSTLQYVGSTQERLLLRGQFDKCNVIITSYEVIRKDVDYLSTVSWNYCILDEGHIIKNSRSKITGAVKQLKAEHRLILSGTPIQNNVLELWSLFDFLMPGFLGKEKQFHATYGKPLLASKDSKCSAKDAEAGILAMEALHKQVMPFVLRRTKDEVLSDLPEKIIQDRFCDLSPLQLKLYEQFSSSNVKSEISTLVKEQKAANGAGGSSAAKATSHVFQAIQYLLKVCSHPQLVVGDKPSDSLSSLLSEELPYCADIFSELHELHHSPKLVALQEILEECGIGVETSNSEGSVAVGHHRVLIFAQHKSLLDIIEKDLFQAHMKSVTYLRLDGSVEPQKRFDIVKAYNSDPTIDILLLTTHVGGLGLNLTSADTLVFMEHDWNPMRDLQAMDRAHRLGQRKVVNVHRLIMRGTLEEKIMSLQKFKVSVANAVINAENASMKTMNTEQLLDLFASAPTIHKGASLPSISGSNTDKEANSMVGGKGLKSILSGLAELWDHSQYTDEYNLSQFLAKLNG